MKNFEFAWNAVWEKNPLELESYMKYFCIKSLLYYYFKCQQPIAMRNSHCKYHEMIFYLLNSKIEGLLFMLISLNPISFVTVPDVRNMKQ